MSDLIDNQKKYQEDFEKQLVENIQELAQLGWVLGVDVKEVQIKDSFIEMIPYGDKITLKAPNITEVETDYGVIKVVK